MKKRTSSMSRRVVSLLMSMVLTLTLVTPAAFATEVVGGSGTAIIEGNDFPGTDLCQLAPFYPEKEGLWPYYKKLLHW